MAEALSDARDGPMPPPLDDLFEFLRIPSISADPAHARDVLGAVKWVQDFLERAGGQCEVVDWRGSPLSDSSRGSTRPWSWKARIVSSGMVEIVSRPISSSM